MKTVCTVRGITLNYSACQLANFVVIKDVILKGDETDKVTVRTEKNIKRKRGDGRVNIVTEPDDKMYGVSFLGEGG
jgi:hypothetical protein